MGALPKQRISRARQGTRRRHHFIPAVQLVPCQSCREMKRPHHVCPSCGIYRGRQVIEIEDTRRASEA
ncbi:MAG: 50S ribosomal protein L32 [Chloroflexia bacterium]|jgi:large subunit ribosomal protein L32|nr:50S ribosomal protein L32 [Chloroflexia bacterium]